MEKFFDVDIFLNRYKKEKEIETIAVAIWLNCSLRHVQKWGKNNNVEYIRKDGRKYYVWDEVKLREFAAYYNRNHNKPRKVYYIPRWDEAVEKAKTKLDLSNNGLRTIENALRKEFDRIAKKNADKKPISSETFIETIENKPLFVQHLQKVIDNAQYMHGFNHDANEQASEKADEKLF